MMKLARALFVVILVAASSAQEHTSTSALPAVPSSASRPAQVAIMAELSSALDARKAHSGDALSVRVTQDVQVGDTLIAKGSKLAGHVEQARPFIKHETDSKLEITFDKVILRNGSELQLPAFVAAIGAAATSGTTDDQPDPSTHVNDRSGCVPGIDAVRASMGQTNSGNASRPQKLTFTSVGVFGLSDLALTAHAGTQGVISVITSSKRNVKLEGGTQLVLRVPAP